MAQRFVAYRVWQEIESRQGGRGRRRPNLNMTRVQKGLLRAAARTHLAGGMQAETLASWTDYHLAVAAAVSVRQTSDLYEEIGFGEVVREALEHLHESGLLQIIERPVSGSYRGFRMTELGLASVDLRPWYLKVLAFFFDTPRNRSATSQ